MNYETAREIEIRVASYFGKTKYVIVPNVSWGMIPYEADLLLLTNSGYVWEIEIKVSRGDLLRDKAKRHHHDSRHVRQLWFAIPEKLAHCLEHIQENAGVITISRTGVVKQIRSPKVNVNARKLSDESRFKLARLGAIRVWSLKEKCAKQTMLEMSKRLTAPSSNPLPVPQPQRRRSTAQP